MREHNLTSDDLKRLPEQLNPEYIFESRTDNEAYVGVLTKDNEPFVAVVKPVRTGLKVTNIIKSAYNKDSGFVNREIKAGRLLYDKKKPMRIRQHRASIAQAFIPSDNSIISQSDSGVKSYQNVSNSTKGAYYKDIIYLFEKADASTFMHETAHWFKEGLKKFGSKKKRYDA